MYVMKVLSYNDHRAFYVSTLTTLTLFDRPRSSVKIKDDIQNSAYFRFSISTTDGRPAVIDSFLFQALQLFFQLKFIVNNFVLSFVIFFLI
jgi:hypothetical protein